ncbi:MAG TPA: RNHCP domain-containing protein [Acidimicrobiia bacterium]|nr:RNHCP domain-containing protein [Acidimicrobiia bacterium]
MSVNFRKTVEDFVCSHCGNEITGNGFTDHCPVCLFSRHVDVTPGDRAALETCGGEMEPISIAPHGTSYKIFYRCLSCGHEYSNKSADGDDVSSFIEKQGGAAALAKRLPPI